MRRLTRVGRLTRLKAISDRPPRIIFSAEERSILKFYKVVPMLFKREPVQMRIYIGTQIKSRTNYRVAYLLIYHSRKLFLRK